MCVWSFRIPLSYVFALRTLVFVLCVLTAVGSINNKQASMLCVRVAVLAAPAEPIRGGCKSGRRRGSVVAAADVVTSCHGVRR